MSYTQIRELLIEAQMVHDQLTDSIDAGMPDQNLHEPRVRLGVIQIKLGEAIKNAEPSVPEDREIHGFPKAVAVDLLFVHMLECGTLAGAADLFDAILNN